MSINAQSLGERLSALLPDVAGAYLFGSVSAGAARADSDVDIALLARAPISRMRLQAARDALEEALARNVDLVDLSDASTILQMEVLRAGPPILRADGPFVDAFELRVMRDYFDLKRRRSAIDGDIALRGRVHA